MRTNSYPCGRFFGTLLVVVSFFFSATIQAEEAKHAELERRKHCLETAPNDYFDPARYASGEDEAYNDKVNQHFRIASWVYSTKKNDPAFRRVLIILLENGYGIDDYSMLIRSLAFAHVDIASARNQYKSLGIHTDEEIESLLKGTAIQRDFEKRIAVTRMQMKRQGITDDRVIDTILSIDVGEVYTGDGSIYRGNILTVWGDRLLTDVDWLDAEFKAAIAKYKGPPRGTLKARIAAWFEKQNALRNARLAEGLPKK